MADVKISGLPASTTPLDGTEVLPIVQGTTTKQVSVANLTAGRSIAMSGLNLTGVTFANLPTASGVSGQIYSVTDVGANGSLWQSNGTTWQLVGGNTLLVNSTLSFIVPSSGSIANNGALTVTTALPRTYGNCYMYFPANAISSGSAAGFYYTAMSSTTVGTIYNNTYSTGVPTTPASPTAFVTTGPGAYTQATSTLIQGPTVTILGNTMGKNGSLNIRRIQFFNNNSAGIKQFFFYFGTQQLMYFQNTTSTNTGTVFYINNTGATNAQFSYASPQGNNQTSVKDTTINQTFYLGFVIATATDYAILDSFQLDLTNN